ncbi:MAG: diaminopimelate decarboxylase [Cyanobacteria bacterium QS_8_64_29]|nr:MAG: diaminopimelate decarboxylase [Cyanobacteria bacterium QS_8_64_29]
MISTSAAAGTSGLQYLPSGEGSPNQQLLPLTARANARDRLEIGGCEVTVLVQQFGSPLYILDERTLRKACRQYRDSLAQYYPGESQVLYASKAWSSLAVARLVAQEGLGIDVASGGELHTALQAGLEPGNIYLHGNNKSRAELQQALDAGTTVVADNWQELHQLDQLASDRGTPVPLLLRVTPGIECHTHDYIRTGHLDSKFGFDPSQLEAVYRFVAACPQLDCKGVHAHIGSQIFELQPHRDLAAVLVECLQQAAAFGLAPRELNLGGGLGIRYTEADDPPAIVAWCEAVARATAEACHAREVPLPRLLIEPGRSAIGPAGITAYTVGSRKVVPETRTYIAVDGGMSDNTRPITYESVYRCLIADRMSAAASETATVAGKHCESGDILIRDAELPAPAAGDTLVVMATGAYAYSMASNYNRLPRPAAVLVADGDAALIVERERYADLLARDRVPARLEDPQSAATIGT